jgi:hypothetical protein
MIGSIVQAIVWSGLSLWSYIREHGSLETVGMIGMFLLSVYILVLDVKISKKSSDSN